MKKLSLVLLLLCTCQVSAMEYDNYGNYINDQYSYNYYNKFYANNHFNNIKVNNKNCWYEKIDNNTLITIKTEQTDNNERYKILNMINGNNYDLLNSMCSALGDIRDVLFHEVIDYKNQPNNGNLILNKFKQQSCANYFVSNKLRELVDKNNVITVPNSCESAYDAIMACYLRIMMKQLSNTKYNNSFHVINYNKNLINIINDIKSTYGYSNIHTSFEYNNIVFSNFRPNNGLSNMKYYLSNNNLKQNLLQTNYVPVRNESIMNTKSKFNKLNYLNNTELNNKLDNISTRSNSPEDKPIVNKINKESNVIKNINNRNILKSENISNEINSNNIKTNPVNNSNSELNNHINKKYELNNIELYDDNTSNNNDNEIIKEKSQQVNILQKRAKQDDNNSLQDLDDIKLFQPELYKRTQDVIDKTNISIKQINIPKLNFNNLNITNFGNYNISENSEKHNNHVINDNMIQQNMKNIEIQIQNITNNIYGKLINTNEFAKIINNYQKACNISQNWPEDAQYLDGVVYELSTHRYNCLRDILILLMQQINSSDTVKYSNFLNMSILTNERVNNSFVKILNIAMSDNFFKLQNEDKEYKIVKKEISYINKVVNDEHNLWPGLSGNNKSIAIDITSEAYKLYSLLEHESVIEYIEQHINDDPETCIKIIVTIIQKWFDKEENEIYYDKLLKQLIENNINNIFENGTNKFNNIEQENNTNNMLNPIINESFDSMKNPMINKRINNMENHEIYNLQSHDNFIIKTNNNKHMIDSFNINNYENNIQNSIEHDNNSLSGQSVNSNNTGEGNPIFRQLKHKNNRNNIVLYNNKYYNEDNNEMSGNSVFNNNINYIDENSIISDYNNKKKYNIENSDIDINNIEYDPNQNETNNNMIHSNRINISAPNILYPTEIPNAKEKYNNINNKHNNIKQKQLQQKKYPEEKVTNIIFSKITGENNIDKLSKPVLNEANLSNCNENLTITEIELKELNSYSQNINSSADGINNVILNNIQIKGIHQDSNDSFRSIKSANIKHNYNIQQLDSDITMMRNNSFNQELMFLMGNTILSDLNDASYSKVIDYYKLPFIKNINLNESFLSDLSEYDCIKK